MVGCQEVGKQVAASDVAVASGGGVPPAGAGVRCAGGRDTVLAGDRLGVSAAKREVTITKSGRWRRMNQVSTSSATSRSC